MSLLIRWLHVSSVAFIFGGALLIFILLQFFKAGRDPASRRVLFDVMRAFEWGSWASIGLVVATGVGNLGHYGEGLPEPRSEWGRDLLLKLGLVLVFLVFSGMRTMTVAIAAERPAGNAGRRGPSRYIAGLYGATAVFVGAIVAAAMALAHF